MNQQQTKKRRKPETKTLSCRVTITQLEKIDEYCKSTGLNRNEFLRTLVESLFDEAKNNQEATNRSSI